MKFNLFTVLVCFLIVSTSGNLFAQQKQVADKIVVIVNDRIILKSEVDAEVAQYMQNAQMQNQDINFSEELWYSALESMIDNYAMLEKAKMDSIVVADELVSRQMDLRIDQLIRQTGGEQQLEEAFGQSIVQIKAQFRDQFREQMIVQEVQGNVVRRVNITRSEVEEFFNNIPESELPVIPEQVSISQIVVRPPLLDEARNTAYQKASALRDSIIVHGKDFEELARKYSDGPSAPRGGLLPMMPINDLVANYSAAASAMEPGEISEVVETEFGYHIIRLNRRSGDEIETNHILIEIDDESIDKEFAINKLEAIRDSVLNHDKRFSDMARKYSDDNDTRATGGRVIDRQSGQRILNLSNLEPAMYRIVLLLEEEGEISEPRSFTLPNGKTAYRIVRLDRHVEEHIANLEDDYERLRNAALEQKRMIRLNEFVKEIRDEIYIEYKIPVPDDVSGQEIDPIDNIPVGTE